ncbi:hypothetical protein J32TS2_10780 [Shouchella clausii]|uniref:hypothetical protein n=1 Tax=Shouchella clausii TaxID=79880 RepID=UPI001B0D8801|nr:hypothetical protein [Shouchella clausii]GIN15722.1 hypothetical protein J32TS2_10780 [Shouchella clausii]
MKRIIENLFAFTLVVTLFLGILLVGGQLLGIIIQNNSLIVKSESLFFEPTIIAASIFGFIAFLFNYLPKEKKVN